MSEAEVVALVEDWFAVWAELMGGNYSLDTQMAPIVAAILVLSRRQSERE